MDGGAKIVKFPDSARVEAEAAEWVVRLDRDDVPTEDYARFLEWQNRSSMHREAAARFFDLWSDFDGLRDLAAPASHAPGWPGRAVRNRLAGAAVAVVAVLLLAFSAIVMYRAHVPAQSPSPEMYETAVGAQKTVTLADGSTIQLNTDTKLAVTYASDRRDVRILRGEAYFTVAHDARRPFVVAAGNRRLRDLGTAFDVRVRHGDARVAVTEGSVALLPPGATENATEDTTADATEDGGSVRASVLHAGHYAVFDGKSERLGRMTSADSDRSLAWRHGVLVYAGEPLAAVIADVRRYTTIDIALDDPALRTLPVGGYFEIDKVQVVFQALERNFGIRVVWRDPQHVRLLPPLRTAGAKRRP